ncbi:hypothetical protein [Tenacibaculum soleae]|uniref:hypothetical protein n=1 Tax=Tenacibaculum soleae TaxID=447689 RepID=UPI002301D6A0|nr:hypothetical protein [Tenacibaculum soleae]
MIKKVRKNLDYIFLYLSLIIITSVIFYLFFKCKIIDGTDKILAALIPLLALMVGVFQILLNQINQKRNKLFELRYQEFQNQITLLQKITNLISENMTNYSIINIHGLVSQLMNLLNEFINFNRFQKEFLFKGITEKESAKKLRDILRKILEKTDEFRKQIDDNNKNESATIKTYQIKWHNDIKNHLKELNKKEYDYLNELKSFLEVP